MKLNEILKLERENYKLTQTELGDKVGVSKQTISAYERGDKLPTVQTLSILADVLDCSTDYLLGRTDNRNIAIVELKDNQHTYKVGVDKKDKDNVTLEDIYLLLKELKKD